MKKIILLLLLSVSAMAQRQIEQKRIENLADSLAKKANVKSMQSEIDLT